MTWTDRRTGFDYEQDIYVQRVDASGDVQWTTDGIAVCTAAWGQYGPEIVPDDTGGAIVTWYDLRDISGTSNDIYAQRVDASGSLEWPTDGLAVCSATENQWRSTVAPDGSGGAIVTWQDDRGVDSDIYAQRVTHSGYIGSDTLPVSVLAIMAIAVAAGSLAALKLRRREVATG